MSRPNRPRPRFCKAGSRKAAAVWLCLFAGAMLYANPVRYPLPALAEGYTGAVVEYVVPFVRNAQFVLCFGHGVAFSAFPPVATPATAIEGSGGVRLSKNPDKRRGLALTAEIKTRLVLNPILFDGEIYEYDFLMGIVPCLVVSYGFPLNKRWALEPFFGSYSAFYACATPWTGFRLYPVAAFGMRAVARL